MKRKQRTLQVLAVLVFCAAEIVWLMAGKQRTGSIAGEACVMPLLVMAIYSIPRIARWIKEEGNSLPEETPDDTYKGMRRFKGINF